MELSKKRELEEVLNEVGELRTRLRDEAKKLGSLTRKAHWILNKIPQSKSDRYAEELASDRWRLYCEREGGYRDGKVRS